MLCAHPSCWKAALLGFRQGVYYGGRIRFFHALVMVMLFRSGPIKDKLKLIL